MPWRFATFALVGLGSTALHVTVAWLLITRQGIAPAPANGAAFLVATLFSCVGNTRWTFAAAWSLAQVLRFLTVTGAMLLLSMGLAQSVQIMGFAPWVGILVIVAIMPVATFTLHRSWTYR